MNNEEKESKYLRYLPSIYQTEKDENGFTFLGRFLKAFEKVLSGIDDGVTIEYLFSWDEIPGNDNQRLIEYLSLDFGVEWVKIAKIEKIESGKTIRVSDENNYLSLELNSEKTEVTLKIDGVSPDEFIVKTENGNLNVYNKPLKGIEEILDTIHDYFDPMETPLEFLNWLAGWVALTLIEGEGWNEEKNRNLIAKTVPLYKKRGTKEGLEEYIRIYVGEDVEVSINEFLQPFQVGITSTVGMDTMIGEGRPYYFHVHMKLPAPNRDLLARKKRAIHEIINKEKPAHTYYGLTIRVPTMQIGVNSTTGVDTLLGGMISD